MAYGEGRGCFKTGLLGCLVLVGVGVLGMLVLGGLAFFSGRVQPEPTTESRAHDLPGESSPIGVGDAAADAATLATEEQLADARSSTPIETEALSAAGVGTLQLDLSMGDFYLVPVEADEPLEVEADYDKARFELIEEFVEGDNDTWTYSVKMRSKRTFLFGGNSRNRVEIRVPKGRPLSIVGDVKMGRADLDLGGLALQVVDLDTGMGEITLDVSAPTGTVAELFRVKGRMGQLTIDSLGNASPQEVDVRFRMGEARVDLDGEWLADGKVSMSCTMGECSARVPDDVFVDVAASASMGGRNVRLPDQTQVPEGAPTVRLEMSGSMGEVRVR